MSTVYTLNGKVLKNAANDKWLTKKEGPGPIILDPLTIRIKLTSGSTAPTISGATVTAVQGQPDVYDVCTATAGRGKIWGTMLSALTSIEAVIAANPYSADGTQDVTAMGGLFKGCTSLTNVALFDTSNVTDMAGMFQNCTALSVVPLFDTTNATNIAGMFENCYNVQSGALALYQQASTQTNPPTNHINTFLNCGRDTVTGAAELAQIPSSWGGTGA